MMKTERRRFYVRPGVLIFLMIVIAGCASQDKYRYENIRTEYTTATYPGDRTTSVDSRHSDVALDWPLSLAEAIQVARDAGFDQVTYVPAE